MARPSRDPDVLLPAALGGDRTALARLVSIVERGGAEARSVGRQVHGIGGRGVTVGITGAPGAGKSTLTSALVGSLRQRGDTVAVLAIDPSSPFSGGAILGDRIRMQDHTLDPGVFIRSLATRGHLGGLSLSTPEVVRLVDAVGFDWVLVETVGVGQVEVEIAGAADVTVVVVNPGWGDAVQAAKAGLMEIADLYVINKADRPGVGETRKDLLGLIALSGTIAAHEDPNHATAGSANWYPPLLETIADRGEGVAALAEALVEHRAWAEASGQLAQRRRARVRTELERIVAVRIDQRIRGAHRHDAYESATDRVLAGELDPWTAADGLLAALEPTPT